MRRSLLPWLLAFVLLGAGFVATIAALNNDLYSARGFALSYVEALARGDSASALACDGVSVPAGENATLLTDAAIDTGTSPAAAHAHQLTRVRVLDETVADGVHTVRIGYELAGEPGFSDFAVAAAGTRFGLFSTWRFAASPLATLTVTVQNDSRFTVNGVQGSSASGPMAVFVPGSYAVSHTSRYLTAKESAVTISEPQAAVSATVEVIPAEGFNAAASAAVGAFLDSCATQTVLYPTGCPFGEAVKNRLTGTPVWSIAKYPSVTVSATGTPGRWTTTVETGTAHLEATVTLLLDGSRSTLSENVDFRSHYVLSLDANDDITVSLPAP